MFERFLTTRYTRLAIVRVALLALAIPAILPLAARAGEWKGSVTTKDGQKTILNPAQGFKAGTSIAMEELWRVGGDTDNDDEFFGVISDIDIDSKGNVYLLDSQLAEVKIFASDGTFIRSIGREGEGPGEFRRPNAMFFTNDGNIAVVQTIPGKIVLLAPDGQPAGDYPLPETEDGGFQMLQGASAASGNVVINLGRTEFKQAEGKWSRTDYLASVDNKGTMLSQYATKRNEINMAAAVLDDAKWDTFERRWTIGPDGKVYACLTYEDYAISVWNRDGSLDKVITREYTHKARSADEKEFMRKMMSFYGKQMPNCEIKIAEMTKDIENLYVRDDGSLWVLSSAGARDLKKGTIGVFDVYNPAGEFVRTVTMTGSGDPLDDLFVFVKNRFYVVSDFLQAAMSAQGVEGLYDGTEEAEPMSVICYKLEGDLLAAR